MSSKKKLLGNPKPPSYVVITNPDGGHTGQSAGYLTLQQAKKLLKDESVLVYIFKVNVGSGLLLKYPLCEYYNALNINILTEEVWCSLNVENLKNKEKDFSEYIELKPCYDDFLHLWEIKIEYNTVF